MRRLRYLVVEFSRDIDNASCRNRHVYASLMGGDGHHLKNEHLVLLGRAWLACGPHVAAPPIERLVGIIFGLHNFSREHALLEGWLLSQIGGHLRRHGWDGTAPVCDLNAAVRDRSCRRHWEWLMRVIQQQCADGRPDWEREILASRVVAALYRDIGVKGLLLRIARWGDVVPGMTDPTDQYGSCAANSQRVRYVVPGIGKRAVQGVFQALWDQAAGK